MNQNRIATSPGRTSRSHNRRGTRHWRGHRPETRRSRRARRSLRTLARRARTYRRRHSRTAAARAPSSSAMSPTCARSNRWPNVSSAAFAASTFSSTTPASGDRNGPLHQLPPEDWDRIINTNLRGVYYCIRSLAPLMIRARSGHIINISSLAGKNALPNGAAYSASKWGLNGLSYSVAEELRAHNIRVSVICPGSVHTEFSPHAGKNAEKMLQATRRGPRRGHDRDAGAAIVRQRNSAAADAETVGELRARNCQVVPVLSSLPSLRPSQKRCAIVVAKDEGPRTFWRSREASSQLNTREPTLSLPVARLTARPCTGSDCLDCSKSARRSNFTS